MPTRFLTSCAVLFWELDIVDGNRAICRHEIAVHMVEYKVDECRHTDFHARHDRPSVRVFMRLLLMVRVLVFMGAMVGWCMPVSMSLFLRAMTMFMHMFMAMGMLMDVLMPVYFLSVRMLKFVFMLMFVRVLMLVGMFAFHGLLLSSLGSSTL
jgi:hypothetical protein